MDTAAWPHGRVLMFSTDVGGRGGIASVVAGLGTGEFAQRYGVRLITSHRDGHALDKISSFVGALGALASARFRWKTALVHVHTASRASFVRKSILLACARVLGYRTILHLHGGAFEQYATREAGDWLQRWIRHSFERADAVLVLSESWAEFVHRFAPAAQVMVLPNAVAIPMLPDSLARMPLRMLFLGRIEAAKGIDELLEAVRSLAPNFPALRLIIAGDGDRVALLARAKALGIEKHLELPGWMSREQVNQELVRAAIFVLPSYQEGLPMALLEAMANACAVVVTAVGGIPQLVQHEVNGLLVQPKNGATLTLALRRLLEDEALCKRLGLQARATILADYSSAAMMTKLGALYERLSTSAAVRK